VAAAVNTESQRQVIGMTVGPSEAATFWAAFLRSLVRRGLPGAQWVISDAHPGPKAAADNVLKATRQRCRVHFKHNAPAHANKIQRRMDSATIATVPQHQAAGAVER
jgi:putative transposase